MHVDEGVGRKGAVLESGALLWESHGRGGRKKEGPPQTGSTAMDKSGWVERGILPISSENTEQF